MFELKQPSMSGFSNLVDPTVDFIESDNEAVSVDFVKNFIPPNENPAEPISIFLYPIRDRSDQLLTCREGRGDGTGGTNNNINEQQQENEEGEVVGSFNVVLFWRDLLRNTLPPSSRGIVVVTQNACGQTFTYEINGAETTYLANKDVHETKYDDIGLTATLSSLLDRTISSTSFSLGCTDFTLLDSTCPITIRITPSIKNEDYFKSKNPIIFAIGAGLIFFFAGGLFLLYDLLVDRRRTL